MPKTRMFGLVFLSMLLFGPMVLRGQDDITAMQRLFLMKEVMPGLETVGIIWNEKAVNAADMMAKIERASASTGIKVVIANVESLKDLGGELKNLIGFHKVQVVWVIGDDAVLGGSVARDFLIKNTAMSRTPLLAPAGDWVDAGACMAMRKVDGKTKLYVNSKTAAAVGISVPDAMMAKTDFFAAN